MSVESPCQKICKLENDVCIGCGRTIDEIINWKDMSDNEKQNIINRLNFDSNDSQK